MELPEHFLCSYEYLGQRCHNAGTVKPPGGKAWYCPAHCPEFPRYIDSKKACKPPGGIKAFRDLLPRLPTKEEFDERQAIQDEA